MSRRGLRVSCAFAVAIGAISIFAFSRRQDGGAQTRDRVVLPVAAISSAPVPADSTIVSGAGVPDAVPAAGVEAAPDARARQILQWLDRNERDEAGRQIAISRVRPPLPDPEKQQQLEIDELEAEREARSLGLANFDGVAARRAELTATRGEDSDQYSQRVAAEERALLADEYLTEFFVRRYLASHQLPNGMPLEEIYRGMRSAVAGLTPEQRADLFPVARETLGELPTEPSYSDYPEQGWNHPSSPEGG